MPAMTRPIASRMVATGRRMQNSGIISRAPPQRPACRPWPCGAVRHASTCSLTLMPSASCNWPSTTTCSPALRPEAIAVRLPAWPASCTLRTSTFLCGVTTKTIEPSAAGCTATVGTRTTLLCRPRVTVRSTASPGQSARSRLATVARAAKVPDAEFDLVVEEIDRGTDRLFVAVGPHIDGAGGVGESLAHHRQRVLGQGEGDLHRRHPRQPHDHGAGRDERADTLGEGAEPAGIGRADLGVGDGDLVAADGRLVGLDIRLGDLLGGLRLVIGLLAGGALGLQRPVALELGAWPPPASPGPWRASPGPCRGWRGAPGRRA